MGFVLHPFVAEYLALLSTSVVVVQHSLYCCELVFLGYFQGGFVLEIGKGSIDSSQEQFLHYLLIFVYGC